MASREYDRAIVRHALVTRKATGPLPPTLTRIHPAPDAARPWRAVWLQNSLERASTSVVGWIDPAHQLPDDMIDALCDAVAHDGVAAATLSGFGRTLTLLGVPAQAALAAAPALRAGMRPVLFAPAGLVVFHRDRVLRAGGIERSLVHGHEDADLGWRLALRGLRSVEMAAAGPVGRVPVEFAAGEPTDRRTRATRLRHEVANELATLAVCAGDDWLRAALPCAVARHIGIAAADAGLLPEQFDFGQPIPDTLPLPVESLARLLAIDDLIRHLPALRRRRAREQAARVRSDEEVRRLFAVDPVDDAWADVAGDGTRTLCRLLGLEGSTRSRERAASPSALPQLPGTSAPRHPSTSAPPHLPAVSVIVLTASGPRHLPACLDSLAALDYPRDRVEVIVVDNGSAVDPAPAVNRHYPDARVIRAGTNLGFCGGNNLGVAAATHDWIFFLNDDTRVDPQLLRAVCDSAARHRAASVAAFVVNWTGDRVDFAGGGINFEAHGFQHGVGSRRLDHWRHERPIAFANGAAMLVHRRAYEAAGGFPDLYFAYYEDVALGWALWIQGHQTWLCPEGLVYHLHHGTSSHSAEAARLRHCERNACFTLLTHASHDTLPDMLAASLLLAAERVVLATGLGGIVDDRLALANDHRLPLRHRFNPRLYAASYRAELRRRGMARAHGIAGSLARVGLRGVIGALGPLYRLARWGGALAPAIDDGVEAPSESVAALAAVAEACRRAREVEPHRVALQASRQRPDGDFAARAAGNWLDVIPVDPLRQAEYERAHHLVVERFGLARLGRPG